MDLSAKLFSSGIETLGWTLLHSIWQALVIGLWASVMMRLVPVKFSHWRYTIACAGMVIFLLSSAATFIYLAGAPYAPVQTPPVVFYYDTPSISHPVAETYAVVQHALNDSPKFIDSHMSFIMLCWFIGTALFSLRIGGAVWYIAQIKSTAISLDDAWHDTLLRLARRLHIKQRIDLAQSARIATPMVIGFFKPVVLIPAGMLTGLSPEQIETIFVHELAHIKRHDHIINLIQSFLETIFFFNPFVWMMSDVIRREREYCCDDAVITWHGNTKAYAYALTQLEEMRLTRSPLAVSLAESKNQLLNRIKRIMERSAKNNGRWDRMAAVALVIVGLVCASWLSITPNQNGVAQILSKNEKIVPDTAEKKKYQTARYTKTIVTYDENGVPQQETVEEFEGDEALRHLMPEPDADMPPPRSPAKPFQFPAPPALQVIPNADDVIPPLVGFGFTYDTVPGLHFKFDWDTFDMPHHENLEKLMKELEENFAGKFDSRHCSDFENHIRDIEKRFHDLEKSEAFFKHAEEQARKAEALTRKNMEIWEEKLHKNLKALEHKIMQDVE